MISVVICTYNRSRQLKSVLDDLLKQSVPDGFEWELVIVDNNSTDETQALVKAFAEGAPMPVRYLFEPRQGKSFALNRGVEEARYELLALTDDDVRIDPLWVATMAGAFAHHRCDIIAGRVRAVWDFPQPDWYVNSGPYRLMDPIVEFDLGDQAERTARPPYGANMGLRRSQVIASGGFKTDLGPRGQTLSRGEDTELARRLMATGAVCQYVPAAAVDHPVERHRAEKEYFLRWYYRYGRTQVVLDGISPNARSLLGVPTYLLSSSLESCGRWLLSVDANRRFYYKLDTTRCLGAIMQSFESRHRNADSLARI